MGRSPSVRWTRVLLAVFTVLGLVAGMGSFAFADDPPTVDAGTTTEATEPSTTEDTTPPSEEVTDPPNEAVSDPCTGDPTAEGCEPVADETPDDPTGPQTQSLGVQSAEVGALSTCGATVNVAKNGSGTGTAHALYGLAPAGSTSSSVSAGGSTSLFVPTPSLTFRGVTICLPIPNGVTVFETIGDGHHQTDISCDEGHEIDFEFLGVDVRAYVMTVDNGDVVNCQVTNAPNQISVTKIVPESAPPGQFEIVLEQFQCEQFFPPDCGFTEIGSTTLSPPDPDGDTFGPLDLDAILPHVGIFRVRENVPDGWALTNVECSGGLLVHETEDGYFIKLSDLNDEWAQASCTFENEPNTASVTVTKIIGEDGTVPAGPWTFTGDVDDPVGEPTRFAAAGFPANLALATDGGGNAPFPMVAVSDDGSSVTFTETQQAGFALSEVVCDDVAQTLVDSSWTLTVAPGDAIACTARNLPASIALTKVAEPDSGLVEGQQLTFTIEATNTGEAELDNVVVTDDLPTSLSFVSSADCSAAGQLVTCDLGDDLLAGQTREAQMIVAVNAGVVGTIENTAQVTADPLGIADPVSAVASANVTVVAVGGEVVVAPPGVAAATGTLPFTGNSGLTPLYIAATLAGLGFALTVLARQRRRSSLGA